MAHRAPENSVVSGYFELLSLADAVGQALQEYEPNLYMFSSFREEALLLHRGMLSLLRTIDAPIDFFVELGLRIGAESWQDPPPDSLAAMQEVGTIMQSLESLINMSNRNLPILDYHPLFDVDISNMLHALQDFYNIHPPEEFNMYVQQFQARHGALGATDEQINAMPVHTATNEDVDQECSICISNFVVGEQMKILDCSHRFHKKCINKWLKTCAICPMDRSRVFSN